MKARMFFEISAYTPSSAWAARPLASGARWPLIVRRSGSSVGVGCPSFGGQRTDRARFSGPRAKLVTASNPSRPGKRVGVFFWGLNSQTAKSRAFATVGRSVVSLCHGQVTALGKRNQVKSATAGLTEETAKIPTPVQQSRAPVPRRSARRSSLPSGSGWRGPVPASPAPNPSVKGTSTSGLRPLAAAPYVER